jgi:hypothetical protein
LLGRVDAADCFDSDFAGAGFAAVPLQARPMAGYLHCDFYYGTSWYAMHFSPSNTEFAGQLQYVTCQWHAGLQSLLVNLPMEYDQAPRLLHTRYPPDLNSDPPACETLVFWAADPDFPWLPQRANSALLLPRYRLSPFLYFALYLL